MGIKMNRIRLNGKELKIHEYDTGRSIETHKFSKGGKFKL